MLNANNIVSDNSGSTNNGPVGAPAGQPTTPVGQGVVDEKMYKELETKLGTMGNELGEYRTFFQSVSPLLEKLDQAPDIVQAILDGKIDSSLAKAAYEGRVDIKDAAVVSQASQAISQALGQKGAESLTVSQIEKLIEDKAKEIRNELDEKTSLAAFEERTTDFIASTKDFPEFAGEIDKWLDAHPDVNDVEIAYWAVKGKLSSSVAQKTAEEIAAENAKNLMANASGGGVHANASQDGVSIVDQLISGSVNPNIFH